MAVKGKIKYFWLGYCIPYIFLAMNEDAVKGTLWFYLITIAAFSFLTDAAVKSGKIMIIICGNIVSFLLSLAFASVYQTEKWLWYFKPFGPYSLMIALSSVLLIIQLIYCSIAVKNKNQ